MQDRDSGNKKNISRREFLRLAALTVSAGTTLPLLGCLAEATMTPTEKPVDNTSPTFEPTKIPTPTEAPSRFHLEGSELSIYNSDTKIYDLVKNGEGVSLEVTAVKENESSLLIASNNKIFEWNKEIGMVEQEVKGVWPKEIKIAGFEEVENLDRLGNPLGVMYQGKDDKGRIMLVKPAGEDEKWTVAPFGSAISNGVWRVWNSERNGSWKEMGTVDAQGEMAKSSRLEMIAKIVTEELTNPEQEGEMYSYSNYTDFGLEVVPGRGHEVYAKVLEAYAKSPVNRKYWNEVGFGGNSGEDLYQWLKGNKGGPEGLPYWLPGKSPEGTKISSIMSTGPWTGHVLPWDPIVNNGGVYMKDVPYVFVSAFDYRNSVWANSFITQLKRENEGKPRPFIWVAKDVSDASLAWGMFLLGNRVVFTGSNTFQSPVFPLLNLGDEDGGKQSVDPKVATAWLIEYTSHLRNIPNKDTYEFFCFSKTLECGQPKYVEVETMTDVLFQFK